MCQSKRNSYINQRGYTLLEALFQLTVVALLSHLFIFSMLWIHQMNKTFFDHEQIAWEMFVQDVQQYFKNVEKISSSSIYKKVTIQSVNSSETKYLEFYGDVIRLQIDEKGHVPLLIGVKNVDFTLHQEYITISVLFHNGIKKERTFFVQKYNQ